MRELGNRGALRGGSPDCGELIKPPAAEACPGEGVAGEGPGRRPLKKYW